MTNLKDVKKITLDELRSDIEWLEKNKCGCCHHEVACTDEGTVLCIVVGWEDGFEKAKAGTPLADGTYRICAKIAYQHANNCCQCDYGVDWLMPYDPKTGNVDDTSTSVSCDRHNVKWLNDEARRVWKDWRNVLDKLS